MYNMWVFQPWVFFCYVSLFSLPAGEPWAGRQSITKLTYRDKQSIHTHTHTWVWTYPRVSVWSFTFSPRSDVGLRQHHYGITTSYNLGLLCLHPTVQRHVITLMTLSTTIICKLAVMRHSWKFSTGNFRQVRKKNVSVTFTDSKQIIAFMLLGKCQTL